MESASINLNCALVVYFALVQREATNVTLFCNPVLTHRDGFVTGREEGLCKMQHMTYLLCSVTVNMRERWAQQFAEACKGKGDREDDMNTNMVQNEAICLTVADVGEKIIHFKNTLISDISKALSDCISQYRVNYKSLRDFRTRLRNNQDRHGRKEHINR